MSTYVLWRVVKFIGIALVGAGSLAGWAEDPALRARLGFGAATAGWLLTWIAGWGLIKTGTASMADGWVSAGLLFSLLGFAGSAAAASGRHRAWTGLSVGGLVAAIVVMTLRSDPLAHPIALGVGALFGAAAASLAVAPRAVPTDALLRWFGVLAKLEGVSLLALFGVFMPAKYMLHIELDAGQGWFGWFHGMMVMGYVASVIVTAQRCGWSVGDRVVGILCSFFPFATFWFERKKVAAMKNTPIELATAE